MKTPALSLAGLLALASAQLFGADAPATSGPYKLLKSIDVPTAATSWDYLSVDSESHRLYVSNGNSVVVIDTAKDAVAGQVDGLSGVHGIAVAAKLGRGFVSNGRGNNVSVVDLSTLKTLSTVAVGQNPDWIMFEPTQGEIYTFNGRSNDSTVFNADTGKVVATIPLGGKPETAVADPKLGRIYDNIEDTSEVVAIDIKTHTVAERWPIAPGKAASGMAIDLAHQRLFLGCGDSNTMVMFDYAKGKVAASVPIGAGVDACAFDPGTQLAFSSSGGNGTVTIAHEDAPDKLTVVQTLATARGSRTMTLDPATHKIYLAAVNYATPAAGAAPSRRGGAAVAGSFHVLVYGLDEPAKK
jgi:YVTN family beta-propeller protein